MEDNPKYRISISTVTHKGKELECYVPEAFNGFCYSPILEHGSYILKESYDPVEICKVCHGDGCNQCRHGFRKGVSVDQNHIAEMFINAHKKKHK